MKKETITKTAVAEKKEDKPVAKTVRLHFDRPVFCNYVLYDTGSDVEVSAAVAGQLLKIEGVKKC